MQTQNPGLPVKSVRPSRAWYGVRDSQLSAVRAPREGLPTEVQNVLEIVRERGERVDYIQVAQELMPCSNRHHCVQGSRSMEADKVDRYTVELREVLGRP